MSASFYSTISYNPTTSKYIVKYGGKSIDTTVTDKAVVADQWVQEIYNKYGGNARVVVGLDVEWRPTFIPYKSSKSATLQLCVNDKCLILQLFYMDGFPVSRKRFFMDPRFTFVGVEVEKGIRKLTDEYGLEFRNNEDIRQLAIRSSKYLFIGDRASLKELAMMVSNVHLNKPKNICQSNWEARTLSIE